MTLKKKLGILALTALCVSVPFASSALAKAKDARVLGRTVLSYAQNDIDLVRASGKCPANAVSEIKVSSLRGTANIETLIVQYDNNKTEKLAVRQRIREGGESRWIDLSGDKRCVKGFAVVGDTTNRSNQRALVQISGR